MGHLENWSFTPGHWRSTAVHQWPQTQVFMVAGSTGRTGAQEGRWESGTHSPGQRGPEGSANTDALGGYSVSFQTFLVLEAIFM